jgi:hypothetical protein
MSGAVGCCWHDQGVSWPPKIGEPLPRADAAWYEPVKLHAWVLAERGHGAEWQRVFHVGAEDNKRVWEAIFAAVQEARIATVRDRGAKGVICGVEVQLSLGDRAASVRISWHYVNDQSAPRLVTAYIAL